MLDCYDLKLNLVVSIEPKATRPSILDYKINLRTELEIMRLHEKFDILQIAKLHDKLDALTEQIAQIK